MLIMSQKAHLPPIETINAYVEELKKLPYSQEKLAEKLDVSQPTISRLFDKGVGLSYELAYKIVRFIQDRSSTLPDEPVSGYARKSKEVVSICLDESIHDAIKKMGNTYTQLPVFDKEKKCKGIITDLCIMQRMMNHLELEYKKDWLKQISNMSIEEANIVELIPTYPYDTSIREVAEGLIHHYAVLIKEKNGGTGIITRADLVANLL